MDNIVELVLVGALVEMQERLLGGPEDMKTTMYLIDQADRALAAMGYDPSDWGPYTVIDGHVKLLSELH